MIFFAAVALAHTVNWYIPGLGEPGYWGYGCHDDRQYPILPYDYHFCGGAWAYQAAAGSFDWRGVHVTNGIEYAPPDWFGDFTIWDQGGGRLRLSSALFCVRVYQDQYVYFSEHNPSSRGTYEQASGAGDAGCYSSYIVYDDLGVIGF
jgi:hypothetical protein